MLAPETSSQAVIMGSKKSKMQKSPNRISKHGVSFPSSIHWQPAKPTEFKGKIGSILNHEQMIIATNGHGH